MLSIWNKGEKSRDSVTSKRDNGDIKMDIY